MTIYLNKKRNQDHISQRRVGRVFILIVFTALFSCENAPLETQDILVDLSVWPENSGQIISAFENPVLIGDTLVIKADPAGSYEFSHWHGVTGDSTQREITIIVEKSMQVIAFFALRDPQSILLTNRLVRINDRSNIQVRVIDFPWRFFTTFRHYYALSLLEHSYPNAGDIVYSYDFSDSYNPVIIDSLELQTYSSFYPYHSIVEGNTIFQMDFHGIHVFDVSDPYNILHVGYTNLMTNYAESLGFVKYDDLIYYTNDWGLSILDASDPANLQVLTQQVMMRGVPVAADENILLLNTFWTAGDSIHFFDVSDVQNPVQVNSLQSESNAIVQNGWLYMRHNGMLTIVDITDPLELRLAGTLATERWLDSALDDDVLLLMNQDEGTGPGPNPVQPSIIDISDPYNPFLIARLPVGTYWYDSYSFVNY